MDVRRHVRLERWGVQVRLTAFRRGQLTSAAGCLEGVDGHRAAPSVGSCVLNSRPGVSFHGPTWTASAWAEAEASCSVEVAVSLWLTLQTRG
ncbi:hypothetical protein BN2537_2823 [Streptomyces venezuelae]|nr:hypothetical protein BN2537_2823 [Streptomyces venezuelae]